MPRRILSLCVLLVLATAPTADAQLYLTLVGQDQGPIDGDVTLVPLTGTIATSAFSLSVATYIDQVTGQPTGQLFVSPLSLSKLTDAATINIIQAMMQGELLSTCVLEHYRPTPTGPELYLRLTLSGAKVESWALSASGSDVPSESMSIVFDTLEWRDFDTGAAYSYSMGLSSTIPWLNEKLALASAPNPTAGDTEFAFRLPTTGSVSIDVYDFRGRHVSTVFDGEVGADQGSVHWDGRDAFGQPVSSGIYLVKMRAGEWLTTTKMSVLR